jgi:peptidoglycan/xylan/chitin deacetylase (PgdA/CDA1 family)
MAFWPFILAPALLAGGAFAARFTFWRPSLPGVPALMYHYLSDDTAGTGLKKLRVKPAAFARQMAALKRQGYETVGPRGYLEAALGRGRLPERPVLITFDDGGCDCLTRARDVLAGLGFTATVFLVTDHVGGANAWDRAKGEPELALLSWAEAGELVRAGWEIGSHTRTHADLARLDAVGVASELAGSRQAIEAALGVAPLAVSYPYGHASEAVRAAAAAAGYRLGFTTDAGKNTPGDDPMALKRIIVKRKDTALDFALKLSKGRSTL